jgi:hypothetical protein
VSALAPATYLLLLLSTALAALAHGLYGRNWQQLPLFWLTALIGTTAATWLNWRLPLNLVTPAGIPMLEATLLAWLLLIAVSRIRL